MKIKEGKQKYEGHQRVEKSTIDWQESLRIF